MLRWSIQSALFIDYENVAHRVLPDTIANWVAWLERGEFDAKRKRRTFLQKRIYWNVSADDHRGKFKRHGFEPVVCERFTGLKNGADIKMAIDVIEATIDDPRISEFILVTRDSDFVPVLQRLRAKKKRTAILADEENLDRVKRFRTHADIVIPMQEFLSATNYSKPVRSKALRKAISSLGKGVGQLGRRVAGQLAARRAHREGAAFDAVAATREAALIDVAANHVVRVTSLRPNQPTGRREIERELGKVTGFSKTGRRTYFGTESYRALMAEVAKRTGRIQITEGSGGGISVTYIPKDDEKQRLRIKRRKIRRKHGWPPGR